ncbi:unnamed protein product [Paramecium sonneborni]|uniref:J domain-containing protein n=1 Tax=Paramecium sonneborni TaxID=65129 RepID=A0A8S1KC42_9CILI|nr:unnamed protein product [Paramecium sonneborni]
MINNHYDILGVKRDAKQHQIKKAYHKLALKWHPDKNREQRAFALDQFHRINEAYHTLSKLDQKILYDHQLSRYESIETIKNLISLLKHNNSMDQNNDFDYSYDNFLSKEELELLSQFKKRINQPGIQKKIRKSH